MVNIIINVKKKNFKIKSIVFIKVRLPVFSQNMKNKEDILVVLFLGCNQCKNITGLSTNTR